MKKLSYNVNLSFVYIGLFILYFLLNVNNLSLEMLISIESIFLIYFLLKIFVKKKDVLNKCNYLIVALLIISVLNIFRYYGLIIFYSDKYNFIFSNFIDSLLNLILISFVIFNILKNKSDNFHFKLTGIIFVIGSIISLILYIISSFCIGIISYIVIVMMKIIILLIYYVDNR